jgi:hypothetical protein
VTRFLLTQGGNPLHYVYEKITQQVKQKGTHKEIVTDTEPCSIQELNNLSEE